MIKDDKNIAKLFALRDRAVAQKDRVSFLSTQVGEVEGGGSNNYIALDKMATQVLHVYEENELEKVVFVKETYQYKPNGKEPYSSFPLYFLTNTVKGWKIYRVR